MEHMLQAKSYDLTKGATATVRDVLSSRSLQSGYTARLYSTSYET